MEHGGVTTRREWGGKERRTRHRSSPGAWGDRRRGLGRPAGDGMVHGGGDPRREVDDEFVDPRPPRLESVAEEGEGGAAERVTASAGFRVAGGGGTVRRRLGLAREHGGRDARVRVLRGKGAREAGHGRCPPYPRVGGPGSRGRTAARRHGAHGASGATAATVKKTVFLQKKPCCTFSFLSLISNETAASF